MTSIQKAWVPKSINDSEPIFTFSDLDAYGQKPASGSRCQVLIVPTSESESRDLRETVKKLKESPLS